jgi:hypothetical protein
MKDNLHPIFIKLPADQIVLLKCLVESYEGIAELRTLDADLAIVVLLAMEDTKESAYTLLYSEKDALQAEIIERPDQIIMSDWLLSSLLD